MSTNVPALYRGHLIVKDDSRLDTLIPHAKVVNNQEGRFHIVPHALDEYRVLRNLGYDIAPPILTDYEFPVVNGFQPFDAQRFTAALIVSNDRSFVLNDLGTGKTRGTLFAVDYLQQAKQIQRALVLCPLSTMRETWMAEVMRTYPTKTVQVLYGTAERRHKLLEKEADIYVLNHDGLPIMIDALLDRKDIDMVIVDELTKYKNANTKGWKIADRLIRAKRRSTALTGQPMPQDPTDAYGQIKLMTPARVSGWSYSRFRDHTMTKITNFRYVRRPDANERVFAMMQPSVRFTRDQCMDLPPVQYVDYQCPLTPEQRTLFNAFKKEAAAQLSAGSLVAANEADKRNKMLQIVLGCIYGKDGAVQYIDSKPRLQLLEDILGQAQGKVIVYTPYKHSLSMIADHLSSVGIAVDTVSGDTPAGERDRIFARFQMPGQGPRVLAAHPQCMSHGLTLTEAATVIWYGLAPSNEIYHQANARITRPGQKRNQYIAHISATSLESAAYKRQQQRSEASGLFLEMVKNQSLAEVL